MADTFYLNENFNTYLTKAKKFYEAKKFVLAKKYYLLAAETMLKIAKESEGSLRDAQYKRAKNLINIAQSISGDVKPAESGEASLSDGLRISENNKVTLEEALEQLNKLEGLHNVKTKIAAWVDQIQVFKLRKEKGLPVPPYTYHMIFAGNPGTGKTTVARIVAQIYCALGIVTKGHLVEVDRSDLVAGYVGQTALKTKEVVSKAVGGVLFIDEAYALTATHGNDFGGEAVNTLLKLMEDNRNDLAVIVAGYSKEMEEFISSNPGLSSRFKTTINFDDYNPGELFRIFKGLCSSNGYKTTATMDEKLINYFHSPAFLNRKDFSNARDVRNIFEEIISIQSSRVSRIENPNDDELCLLKEEDLPYIIKNFSGYKAPNDDLPPLEEETPKAEKPEEKRVDTPTPVVEDKPASKPEEVSPEDTFLNGANTQTQFKWDEIPTVSFDDIAGLDDVKKEVNQKVLLPLKNPDMFEGYDKKNGGGLFLYGPPGTGKTMIAAAIAHEIGSKFCSVKPSDILSSGVGNTEKAIKQLFLEARRFPSAVIYFDEIESIAPKVTRSSITRQLRSEFLAQLQGVETYGKDTKNTLYVIASTNKPWDVDSAFVRPGRFGTKIYVGLPDFYARKYLIENKLNKIRKANIVEVKDDINVDDIANRTNGYNGSDMSYLLDKVLELSAIRALQELKKEISMQDFEAALELVKSSVQQADIEKLAEWRGQNE